MRTYLQREEAPVFVTVKEFNQLFAIFLAPASHTATALLK